MLGAGDSARAVNALRVAVNAGLFPDYRAAVFASQPRTQTIDGFPPDFLLAVADQVPGPRVATFDHAIRTTQMRQGRGSAACLRRILGVERAGSTEPGACRRPDSKAATDAHVLDALARGVHPPHSLGRVRRLPKEKLAADMVGLCERGLSTLTGFTDAGRATKERVEALADGLAAAPYEALSCAERDGLVAELEPITAVLVAAGSK